MNHACVCGCSTHASTVRSSIEPSTLQGLEQKEARQYNMAVQVTKKTVSEWGFGQQYLVRKRWNQMRQRYVPARYRYSFFL